MFLITKREENKEPINIGVAFTKDMALLKVEEVVKEAGEAFFELSEIQGGKINYIVEADHWYHIEEVIIVLPKVEKETTEVMDIEDIFKKNREFCEWREQANYLFFEYIETKKSLCLPFNKMFTPEYVGQLSREQIIPLNVFIRPNVDRDIASLLREYSLNSQNTNEVEVPVANKALYFPVINEVDFIDNRQKKQLDQALMSYYGTSFSEHMPLIRNIKCNEDKLHQLFRFLVDRDVITELYYINPPCGHTFITKSIIIDKKQLAEYDRFFELKEAIRTLREDAEYSALEKKLNLKTSCLYCGKQIIDSKESLYDNLSIKYSIVAEPTFEQLKAFNWNLK